MVSDSVQYYGLLPARLLCPQDSPGKNTGVDCHALLQWDLPNLGIEPMFLTSPARAARFFTTGWENKIKLTEMTRVKMPGKQHMLGKH